MNSKILIEAMRKRGIRESLIRRCEEIIKETRHRVRIREEIREVFWTGREVRQRCPYLFNILMADLDKEMRKSC